MPEIESGIIYMGGIGLFFFVTYCRQVEILNYLKVYSDAKCGFKPWATLYRKKSLNILNVDTLMKLFPDYYVVVFDSL